MSEAAPNASCPNCARLEARLAEVLGRMAELEAKVAELEAKVRQNSSNSSKPPSSDPPWQKQSSTGGSSGRKRGGQPGHTGHYRVRLPPERLKAVVSYIPKVCTGCQAPLSENAGANDPPPAWHQVAEVPSLAAEVTEHQGHARTCSCCGKVTQAEIPAEIRAHTIGPRLAALLSYLSGRCHDSKRTIQEIAESVFHVPVSLGTIVALEQEMSAALAAPHAEALAAVRAAPIKNVDETGWSKRGKLCWLWVAATLSVVVFRIHPKRGKTGLKALLGKFTGIVCSDRWGAYAHLPQALRQICWAHLKRDFQKLYELGGKTKTIGRAGRRAVREVFGVWKDFKDGRSNRAELQARLQPVRIQLHDTLYRGSTGTDPKTRRFCRRLLNVYDALWTFSELPGVEPTNNHAERMVRPAVLWRKRSFGNHSKEGCRFAERILTTVQTLRLQKRPVLDYLRCALIARRSQTQTPALLAA